MKSLLFYLSLIVCVAYVLGVECPYKESISPCTCQSDDSGSRYGLIECSNLKSIEEYLKIVNKSEDYPFTRVKLSNLSMLYFPARTQAQKRCHYMWIEDSSFATLFENLSHVDTSLLLLSLKNVVLQRGLQWKTFEYFKNLQIFEVQNVYLTRIEKDFGTTMPLYLQNVTFSNNKLQVVSTESFSALTYLLNVTVKNNLIRNISRSMFSAPFNVHTLDFSNNLIATLPNDTFINMPYLKEVSFRGNLITTLDEQTFRILPTSVHVAMEESPIDCDCKVHWLTTTANHAYITGNCSGLNKNAGIQIQRLQESDFDYCYQLKKILKILFNKHKF